MPAQSKPSPERIDVKLYLGPVEELGVEGEKELMLETISDPFDKIRKR